MASVSAQMGAVVILLAVTLSLPAFSSCARVYAQTGNVANVANYQYKATTDGMCATDFSQVSYAEVTAACPPNSNSGASPACCTAFNNKACQYEALVNNFNSMCPVLFIDYLNAAGPYPAGYFVGRCIDGTKGFCIRQ